MCLNLQCPPEGGLYVEPAMNGCGFYAPSRRGGPAWARGRLGARHEFDRGEVIRKNLLCRSQGGATCV